MSLSKAKKNHALGPHASTSMEAAINVLPMSGRDRAIAIPASPPVRVPQSDPVHTALILLWTHFGDTTMFLGSAERGGHAVLANSGHGCPR